MASERCDPPTCLLKTPSIAHPLSALAQGMPAPVAATMPTASAGPEVAEAGSAPLAPLKASAALDVDALFSEEGRARQQGSLRWAGVVQSQPPASPATRADLVDAELRRAFYFSIASCGAAPAVPHKWCTNAGHAGHALPAIGHPVKHCVMLLPGHSNSRRSLAGQFAGVPGIVSLSGGFPPASLFPFAGLTLHLAGSGAAVPISDPAAVSSRLLA